MYVATRIGRFGRQDLVARIQTLYFSERSGAVHVRIFDQKSKLGCPPEGFTRWVPSLFHRVKKRDWTFSDTWKARSTLKSWRKSAHMTLPDFREAEARPTPNSLRDRAILSPSKSIFGEKGRMKLGSDCSKWLIFYRKSTPRSTKKIFVFTKTFNFYKNIFR